MTTIAWDGKQLAADGGEFVGNTIVDTRTNKITIIGYGCYLSGYKIVAIACAGHSSGEFLIVDAMRDGMDGKTEFPEHLDMTALAVTDQGNCLYISKSEGTKNCHISPSNSVSIGSGYISAQTMLNLGYDAISAVEAAKKTDCYTCGITQVWRCGSDLIEIIE